VDVRAQTSHDVEPIERETIKRVAWRLMPLLMLGYFCNFLDRVNVGMAAPTMNPDLGFSSAVYGFGAGIFFLGYFVFEIPSNLLLNRIGARRWLAGIFVSWGIVSGLTAFVWNDWSFYGIRCLLGLAEAGFFPGAVLYMTWWFPSYYRTRMIAVFFTSIVASLIIGPPISGLLLNMNGLLALRGWQWLFLLEALPSLIMAVVIWQLLTDRPNDADWLSPEQKAWLNERLASERAQREAVRKYSLAEAFTNRKVWLLTLAYFGHTTSQFGLTTFMPLIVKGLGVPTNMIGLVSGAPFIFALAAVLLWGRHSDRTGERKWHAAAGWATLGAGMAAGIFIGGGHPILLMIALCFAAMGTFAGPVIFWSLPSALLTGAAAAGGIAMINAAGSLGGWLGPWLFGLVKDATGSDTIALLCLAGAAFMAAIAVVVAGHDRRMERIPSRG
jgi:MFS family permease